MSVGRVRSILGLTVLIGAGCGREAAPEPLPFPGFPRDALAVELNEGALGDLPRIEGLGDYSRPVTAREPLAQRYFDQALNQLYAFHHDEAIRSFRRAAELDPSCAMAWWGVALANGPHLNDLSVSEARARAALRALEQARERARGATEVERALIDALTRRYAPPPIENRRSLDRAYADAMREVYRRFPNDADVVALFAEALIDLRPWDLWTPDGQPRPGTEEIVALLESVLARRPEHPFANHLYIHAIEASVTPERGDSAADRLRHYAPASSHLLHMPSHIDVRRGRWAEAIAANQRAIEADRALLARRPEPGFYRLYMMHNPQMLAWAAMMTGREELATRAIRDLVEGVPAQWWCDYALWADGYAALPLEVLMRFGRWEEILVEPAPPPALPVAGALRHFARGVALAATGEVTDARAEQRAFRGARERVPQWAFFGTNPASDLLGVADSLLDGEILWRAGDREAAFAALREGVRREDRLRYDEPPAWTQPVRHALGAFLMEDRRFGEAEAVYREDLVRIPDNGWSLFGLARSLRQQGRGEEAEVVRARFVTVWAAADVALGSSCFCEPGAAVPSSAP